MHATGREAPGKRWEGRPHPMSSRDDGEAFGPRVRPGVRVRRHHPRLIGGFPPDTEHTNRSDPRGGGDVERACIDRR